MSLVRPITNRPITSMKPITPERSITARDTGRPRSFSTTAQKM